ncbi:hypothetical protein EDEG_02482 [Edhazardia aedis USNM 41457]|uniref:Uncharacterized protein n=1 Tax=Edhazardia aedis (strain USNM 41457) TaxID=1003232 RepID=J9D6K5_EDHAE|nr:hypothetical protein EDEG_02482 [Edhazardia aedis USNM 41457]|eukprot:EJW03144.1 hypothetical protein EDEG_02482 [Edhazardia aedis USNM 41457]
MHREEHISKPQRINNFFYFSSSLYYIFLSNVNFSNDTRYVMIISLVFSQNSKIISVIKFYFKCSSIRDISTIKILFYLSNKIVDLIVLLQFLLPCFHKLIG